jgi:hypothetical protein
MLFRNRREFPSRRGFEPPNSAAGFLDFGRITGGGFV